ncbi:MAG TPA: aminotransferase class V-fold PLP-dependent enzyme, partial [Polyangiaceae bacterium]|nr:aminotransferase class V-fold PLP-dependent enzyme [Polyangiaceae bacterium]
MKLIARGDLSRYHTSGQSEVQRLEEELCRVIGVEHTLGVNSGTSALICGLVGAGVGPGDEVLVPAYTWVSSAAAPLAVGAVPVLVEINETLTIDPEDIRKKITPQTKAIIVVHMLNLVCDMDSIMAIAKQHDLVVIEDACQAVGVTYKGRRVGSIGHVGAFSFNQHKNIQSGEGGAVLTSDPRIHARALMYHDVG